MGPIPRCLFHPPPVLYPHLRNGSHPPVVSAITPYVWSMVGWCVLFVLLVVGLCDVLAYVADLPHRIREARRTGDIPPRR